MQFFEKKKNESQLIYMSFAYNKKKKQKIEVAETRTFSRMDKRRVSVEKMETVEAGRPSSYYKNICQKKHE